MTDTQPFMDEARELRQRVLWESNSSIQHIATALSSAYQRGRDDAAKIIEAREPIYTLLEQKNALRECISSIRATAIRTERDKG